MDSVDFNAYFAGQAEAIDEIVFSTTTQVMETFGKLFGGPLFSICPLMKRDSKLGRASGERESVGSGSDVGRADTSNAVGSKNK